MDWNKKKVLVTGASGFIGSHLVEELVCAGSKVRAFIHYNSRNDYANLNSIDEIYLNEIDLFPGDIRDPYIVRESLKEVDIVFHLAALIGIPYSYSAPQSYVETNIQGTLNVLQASLDEQVEKIINTSTSEVYGTAKYVPIDEVHPLNAQSPYAATKIAADKLAESYYLTFGLPVATIRPFNTFGPRQSARAVIPTVLTQLISGVKAINIGSLAPVRDFNYVKDTAKGFMAIAESENTVGEVTNIGSGIGITIGELLEKCFHLLGQRPEIISDDRRMRPVNSDIMRLVCNSKKAKKIAKWIPEFSLKEGLIKTIEFIEENPCLYNSDSYHI
jgi:NAD dependent epimerase/dehydratase